MSCAVLGVRRRVKEYLKKLEGGTRFEALYLGSTSERVPALTGDPAFGRGRCVPGGLNRVEMNTRPVEELTELRRL